MEIHIRIELVIQLLMLLGRINGQTTLQIVWMAPASSHSSANFIYNASSSVAALALGLKYIQENAILPDYVLK